MILEIKKRGTKYRISGYFQGKRIRASLGTANAGNADVWKEKIKRAVESGPDCMLWPELKRLLPPQTFRAIAELVGYQEKTPPIVPTWADLIAAVGVRDQQRIQLGKLALSTKARYDQSLKSFTTFLRQSAQTNNPSLGGKLQGMANSKDQGKEVLPWWYGRFPGRGHTPSDISVCNRIRNGREKPGAAGRPPG